MSGLRVCKSKLRRSSTGEVKDVDSNSLSDPLFPSPIVIHLLLRAAELVTILNRAIGLERCRAMGVIAAVVGKPIIFERIKSDLLLLI